MKKNFLLFATTILLAIGCEEIPTNNDDPTPPPTEQEPEGEQPNDGNNEEDNKDNNTEGEQSSILAANDRIIYIDGLLEVSQYQNMTPDGTPIGDPVNDSTFYSYAFEYDNLSRLTKYTMYRSKKADLSECYKVTSETLEWNENYIRITKQITHPETEVLESYEVRYAKVGNKYRATYLNRDNSETEYLYNSDLTPRTMHNIYNHYDGHNEHIYYDYTWENGNLLNLKYSNNAERNNQQLILSLSYSDYPNKWHGINLLAAMDFVLGENQTIEIAGLLGLEPANLPSFGVIGNNEEQASNFEYTFDEQGRITTFKISANDWDAVNIYYGNQSDSIPTPTLK